MRDKLYSIVQTLKQNPQATVSESRLRQIGLVYGLYRILLGVFLIIGNYITNIAVRLKIIQTPNPLPASFEYALLGGYLIFAVVSLVVLYIRQSSNVRHQLLIGFFVDMVALTLLLYSGAAKDLQIVFLYTIAIAASFMVLQIKQAITVTLVAILSLVFQQAYYAYIDHDGFLTVADTILFCLSLLAVGFLSFSVSQRLASAEEQAYYSAKEAERLEAINEEVVKNITNGVIVIGQTGRIKLINHTAEQMLRVPTIRQKAGRTAYIFEVERWIVKRYKELVEWYQYKSDSLSFVLNLPQVNEQPSKSIRIHKKTLSEFGILLILESLEHEESYAEQLKLTSLGQLSASIAHEIRNPLGAISQASELLMESDRDSFEFELYEMIYQQTRRVNRIIEDVMRLSRQEPPYQEIINLKQWIPLFLSQHFNKYQIATSFGNQFYIFFDPHHLEQVFVNLVDNALRHTHHIEGIPDVFIKVHTADNQILVDVLDNGDGVADEYLPYLFNPFFTKSVGGTGLGLYLSRSFSEANHARLIYLSEHPKTCFRLIAPIP